MPQDAQHLERLAPDPHPRQAVRASASTELNCLGDCTVGTPIVLVWPKGALRHHDRSSDFLVATKEPKLGEVAGAPAEKLLKPLKLALILAAPTIGIGWLCRCL